MWEIYKIKIWKQIMQQEKRGIDKIKKLKRYLCVKWYSWSCSMVDIPNLAPIRWGDAL